MKATFDIGGYTIIIGGQYVETAPYAASGVHDLAGVVPVQIIHHPQPRVSKLCANEGCRTQWGAGTSLVDQSPDVCPTCGGRSTGQRHLGQPPDETVFYAKFEPSHARALASAILSAATQARG